MPLLASGWYYALDSRARQSAHAGVAELVDAADLKSAGPVGSVRVRVPPSASELDDEATRLFTKSRPRETKKVTADLLRRNPKPR